MSLNLELVEELKNKIAQDKITYLKERSLDCKANLDGVIPKIVEGKKYIKIDVGNSGFIMIEKTTGDIFGIKGYGVIHKSHKYGNFNTINEWFWGEYYPRLK